MNLRDSIRPPDHRKGFKVFIIETIGLILLGWFFSTILLAATAPIWLTLYFIIHSK